MGIKIFLPPIKFASLFIVWGLSLPILKTFPDFFDLAANKKALATSVTKIKSRDYLPVTTTVRGLFFIFCLKKTPKTAP